MDLNDAIIHTRQVAEGCGVDSRDCAYQHDKLGDWLEELQAYRAIGPLDHLRELVDAERDGRCVVLPDAKYTDTDGETALRRAMYICGVQNNAVTRYTADAIAEKLTREEAEAALKGGTHETNPV